MNGVVNEKLAETVSGRKEPHRFPVLDASIMDFAETHRIVREDIKQNKMRYEFPLGFNTLPLREECEALTKLDDFNVMYDVLMQMITDKDVVVKIMTADGNYQTLCTFHVTDRYQDLRGIKEIDEYPVVITWLTEFIAEYLVKKYPVPGKIASQTKAPKNKAGPLKKLLGKHGKAE